MARRAKTALVLFVVLAAGLTDATPAHAASTPLLDVVAVTGGGFHTCARLGSGEARCWGANVSGQLGDGTDDNDDYAVPVRNSSDTAPLTGVREIVTGEAHSCARVGANQVRCWGANNLGQLGDDSNTERHLPVTVVTAPAVPLTGVTQLTAGFTHTCALLDTRQVRCWGGNADGQLGDDSTDPSDTPVVVANVAGTGPLTAVTQISAHRHHTCARLANGQARCWGEGAFGRLGNGVLADAHRPVIVTGPTGTGALAGVTQVSTGTGFSCALLGTGQVRCWGDNNEGQIGDGTAMNRPAPRSVTVNPSGILRRVTQLTSGSYHSCARLDNGRLVCWGRGSEGQLGDGTFVLSRRAGPVQNPAGDADLRGVVSVEAGGFHTCATFGNRRARCWGGNSLGALATGSTSDYYLPVTASQGA